MTATVKNAIVDRAVFESVRFLDRQCIHIGTQANSLFSSAALQHGHYARRPDSGMHVEPGFSEQARYFAGGTIFLKTKLRMLVNILPPGPCILLNISKLTLGTRCYANCRSDILSLTGACSYETSSYSLAMVSNLSIKLTRYSLLLSRSTYV